MLIIASPSLQTANCLGKGRGHCHGKVVGTSFLYLTVYRGIADDVPIYLKFALKVTLPFRKRRFRQISLNSVAVVRASEKSLIVLIGSRNALSIEP